MPNEITPELMETAGRFKPADIVSAGLESEKEPLEIAGALKNYRNAGRALGESRVAAEDPRRFFAGVRKLDSAVREQLDSLRITETTRRISDRFESDGDRLAFVEAYQAAGGDPARMNGFSDFAAELNRDVVENPAFQLPRDPGRPLPILSGGNVIGDFQIQRRPDEGLDVLVGLDRPEGDRAFRRIRVEPIQDEDITAAQESARERAKTTGESAASRRNSVTSGLEGAAFDPSGMSFGAVGGLTLSASQAEAENEQANARLAVLNSEGARAVLLQERVTEAVKADPELSRLAGDKDIFEDFIRGLQQTNAGIHAAVADATGNEELGRESREAIALLDQIYPGSTGRRFRGGTGGFVSEVAEVMGGMTPTLVVGAAGGFLARGGGALARTGVRAGALSPLSVSAYGNALSTMLNEADAFERDGDTDKAEKRREDARAYALAIAAIETGTELIFPEEMLARKTGQGVLKRVFIGSGQNAVEEILAQTGQGFGVDPAFRDAPGRVADVARAGAIGAVAGGVIQVPGAAISALIPSQTVPEAVVPETTDETPIETEVVEPEPEPVAPEIPETVEPEAEAETVEPEAEIEADEATAFEPSQVPVQEVPVDDISLSADVPNFKEGADTETGVVSGEELEGEFQRLGTPPIVLWRRADDGRLEVITGRHRLDLARRSGETTIPAQIVEEAQGFTRDQAFVFDAASNIRDGQGTVRDYAHFFRHSEITEAEARQGGLLSRAKGQSGFSIGRNASDDLYALYRAEKINDRQAQAIVDAAGSNEAAQQIGSRFALEGRDPAFIANIIKATESAATERGETLDLFGRDDSAIEEMERRAKRAGEFQRSIQDRITAAQSAARRPEAARKMGIDVSDPKAVQEKVRELRAELDRWRNWPLHPDLVSLVKGDAETSIDTAVPAEPAESEQAPPQLLPGEKQGDMFDSTGQDTGFQLTGQTGTDTVFQPPDNRTEAEKDADAGQARIDTGPTGSPGQFSAQSSREGGSGIRDSEVPAGTDPVGFTLPALVQLSKELGLDPTVNPRLKNALGRFTAEQGATGKVTPRSVETREGLFRDPDLAVEVLAHEIGHFIDRIPATRNRARLPQRIAPLSKKNWENIFPDLKAAISGPPFKRAIAQALREEAVALSQKWRGNFDPATDRYRASAPELYADFLSALLNAPQWTRQQAPNLTQGFFNAIDQKPAVATAYAEIQDLLRSDRVTERVLNRLDENQQAGIDKVIELSRGDKGRPVTERMRESAQRFRQQYLNRWGPVAAKEGQFRRAATGDSYTDKLEINEGYAARQRALFNDSVRTRVTEPLRAAGVEDRHFNRYLVLNRIINERTQTGQWIEQNPEEARALMAWMAEAFRASDTIKAAIENAGDANLYTVGARMMRELQDGGLTEETITRVENRALFNEDLPEELAGKADKMLAAFNVRGFMLNSEGIDVATARDGLNQTRAEVGEAKWDALTKGAQNLFDLTAPIVENAISLGIYGEGVANEIIRPNLRNYIPFQVLEYFTGDVSAAIKKQRGSVKALQDGITAVSLNTQALLGWTQRQQTAMILERWAKDYGTPVADSGPINGKARKLGDSEKDVVLIWRNGRPHALTFEEPGIAEAANYFEELSFLSGLSQTAGGLFGRLFTKYAPGFIFYTNIFRDIRTSAERLGVGKTLKNYAVSFRLARAFARSATGGAAMTPEIRAMVEEGVLPPPDQSIGRLLTETEVRDSLNAGLSARDLIRGRVRTADNTLRDQFIEFFDKPFVWLGAITESLPKIAGSKTLRERGFDNAMRIKVARLLGIPNPGIGGSRVRTANAFLLFYRVIVQGHRATRTLLLNPKTRGGFMLRHGIGSLLPKFLMFAAATGILKSLLEKSGFDPGDDLEEFYKSLSSYKKEFGDVIPLFWQTPDGIEPVWGHSKDEIGENWQAVGLPIPNTEEGRLFGSLTWNALAESSEQTDSPDPVRTWTRWATSQFPGLNPAIETATANIRFAQGVNPIDSFRNRPIINHTDWSAGGWSRFGAILAWNLGQASGPFFQPDASVDTTGLTDFQKNVRKIGPLRSVLTFDNFRASREQAIERAEKEQLAARTKKALGVKTTELVNLGSRLERMGADGRSASQEGRYRVWQQFNRKLWEGRTGLREPLKKSIEDGDKEEVRQITELLEAEATRFLGFIGEIR